MLVLSAMLTPFMVNADNVRFVVSQYQRDNSATSSKYSKSNVNAPSVNITALTAKNVCLTTIDSGIEICLDRKYMDHKKQNMKTDSYRVNNKKHVKYEALTISLNGATINEVQKTLKNAGWFATVEQDSIFTTGNGKKYYPRKAQKAQQYFLMIHYRKVNKVI